MINTLSDCGKCQVVSHSQVNTWISCPARWWYRYHLGVQPAPPTPLPMTWGSMMHEALEQLCKSGGDPAMVHQEVVTKWMGDWAGDAREAALDPNNHYSEQRMEQDWLLATELSDTAMHALLRYPVQHLHDPIDIHANEAPFLVRMRDARGHPMAHLGYLGILDGLVEDSVGDLLLLERKTTSERHLHQYQLKLDADPQVGGYGTCMGWLSGINLNRILYDTVRRKRPSIPKMVGAGTEKKPYKFSKAGCDTSIHEATQVLDAVLRRAAQEGHHVDEPTCRDYLQALPGDEAFMQRFRYTVSSHQAEAWRSTVVTVARAMRAAQRDPSLVYRNTGQCERYGCAYKALCFANTPQELVAQDFLDNGMVPKAANRMMLDHRHPVLVEPGVDWSWMAGGSGQPLNTTTWQEMINRGDVTALADGPAPDTIPMAWPE